MKYNPDKHHRRSIRLRGFDYSQPGWYFVTMLCPNRECVFGEIKDGEMQKNIFGEIVNTEWLKTETLRVNVVLDEYVIMPNHFHGILGIVFQDEDKMVKHDTINPEFRLKSNSLGSILGQFKSVVTKQINKNGRPDFKWHRNYYEHIIRDEKDMNRIRKYIIENPARWQEDTFFK
jgi:REP element-mobilizing transposase RayT